MKKHTIFFVAVAITGIISLLFACTHVPNRQTNYNARLGNRTMDVSLKEISISFKNKARTGDRLKQGEILFKHLKLGMSRDKVRHLLGEPDPKHSTSDEWFYTIWYSRFIGVEFQNDKVVKITGG